VEGALGADFSRMFFLQSSKAANDYVLLYFTQSRKEIKD